MSRYEYVPLLYKCYSDQCIVPQRNAFIYWKWYKVRIILQLFFQFSGLRLFIIFFQFSLPTQMLLSLFSRMIFFAYFFKHFPFSSREKNPVISHTRSEKNVSSSLIYGSIAWKIWSQSKVQIYKKEMSCYIHIVTYSIRYIKYEQVGIHYTYLLCYQLQLSFIYASTYLKVLLQVHNLPRKCFKKIHFIIYPRFFLHLSQEV